MKKGISLLTIIMLLFSFALLNTTANAATQSFKDVPTSHANYKEIMELTKRGVISGFTDGTFKPTKQVTRAEFAAFVARALDLPAATSNFKDVPKSAALYDGVSKSYKAGVIKGFTDGTFKPNVGVSRQDMAAMLDRAMQLEGSYTKTKALDFSDSSKIGTFAKTSVQRLYYYGVMGAYKGKNFSPTTVGTRAETAVAISNMLEVVEGGTVTPPKPPVNKSYKDMTLTELKTAYPKHNHVLTIRQWKDPDTHKVDMKIITVDMMAIYYKDIHTPASKGGLMDYADFYTPDQWFSEMVPGYIEGYAANYMYYPMREVIAYNGKSYKDSEFMPDNFKITNEMTYRTMPSQPKEKGKFLIDIHDYDDDFVTYNHEDIKTGVLKSNPVKTSSGKDYIVDLGTTFKNATGVSLSRGGLEITNYGNEIVLSDGSKTAVVNGKSVTLSQAVTYKDGVAYGPVREIAKYVGLHTRVSTGDKKRLEIANYELDTSFPNGAWLD